MQRPKKIINFYLLSRESIEYFSESKLLLIATILMVIALFTLFINDRLYVNHTLNAILSKTQLTDSDIETIKSIITGTMVRWFYMSILTPVVLFLLIIVITVIRFIHESKKIFSIVKRRILEELSLEYEQSYEHI